MQQKTASRTGSHQKYDRDRRTITTQQFRKDRSRSDTHSPSNQTHFQPAPDQITKHPT